MKTFFLVRHTEFSNPDGIMYGRLPLPLSNEGVNHAKRIADFFKSKGITTIYTSPVLRCRQTAEIIAEYSSIPLVVDKRLSEILTVLQGVKWQEYYTYPKTAYQFVDELGGESQLDIQLRMVDFFNEKVAQEKGDAIICSHGDPLYFLTVYLTGKQLPQQASEVDRSLYHSKGAVLPVYITGKHWKLGSFIHP